MGGPLRAWQAEGWRVVIHRGHCSMGPKSLCRELSCEAALEDVIADDHEETWSSSD